MMRIEEQIKIDIKKSMIGRNTERTNLLRTIIGEINRNKDKNISDEKVISIIKKMKENAISMNNQIEIDILSEYLPKMLSEKDTIDIVRNKFNNKSYTIKDMGSFMKEIKSEYGSTIDMKLVSNLFKKFVKII